MVALLITISIEWSICSAACLKQAVGMPHATRAQLRVEFNEQNELEKRKCGYAKRVDDT